MILYSSKAPQTTANSKTRKLNQHLPITVLTKTEHLTLMIGKCFEACCWTALVLTTVGVPNKVAYKCIYIHFFLQSVVCCHFLPLYTVYTIY